MWCGGPRLYGVHDRGRGREKSHGQGAATHEGRLLPTAAAVPRDGLPPKFWVKPPRCVCVGPAFIKLGQVLSTRSDVLGTEITDKLAELQDKLPPFHFNEVKKIFKSEFNLNIEDVFSSFDNKSIAAASIAQVHKAITKKGEVVAVKILRPKIKKKYLDNLNFIQSASSALNVFLKNKKKVKINEIIDSTTKHYDFPYHKKTLVAMIVSHFKHLKKMGNTE